MTTRDQTRRRQSKIAGEGAAAWWREAVLYQIYPRSFADFDGDGVGDLRGIVSKLDYLNDGSEASLGVDGIWLSPFYPSPLADFGYDVSDYTSVDPVYGDLVDFDRLVSKARARGIRVLIDLVLNHTSTEHPWFVESRSSRSSPKRDWYVWAPPRADGAPPNNWLSAFPRVGRAWTLDPGTGEYYLHTFTPGQADLNWRNPAVRQAMWEIVRFWLERGVDGFRVDVAHRLIKDEALRDNPLELANEHRHVSHPTLRQLNVDHPAVHEVIVELRRVVDEYPGRTTLGEVPIHDHARLCSYYGTCGDELHMAFNFALWDAPWSAPAFRGTVDALEAALPPWGWPCYALSNHDIVRLASRYDSDGRGDERARLAAVFLLTARGTPCLYYGEELGMRAEASLPARRALDVDGRDPSRTPMQWDDSGSGFGSADPWLPFGADLARANVAVEQRDPSSTLSLYRRLVRLRRSSPALRRGSYSPVDVHPAVYAYERTSGDELCLVLLNFESEPAEVAPALPDEAVVALSTHGKRRPGSPAPRQIVLGPLEGLVVRGRRAP